MILQATILKGFSQLNVINYLSKYIGDWTLALFAVTLSSYMEFFTEPFNRQFSIIDPTINFPFATQEQFTPARLFRYCIILPIIIFTGYHAWQLYKVQKQGNINGNSESSSDATLKILHNYHILMLSFMVGLSLNGLITEFFKNLISKPRPDFIERCGVNYDLLKPNKVNYDSSICTKPLGQALYKDGFKSSPSGHSSFAFTGLGYLSLWLIGQLKIFSQDDSVRRQYRPTYIKLLPLVPILIACKIAISRTQDYRHHFKDIILGSILGLINCYLNYFWFFNRLDDKMSHALLFEDDYKLLSGSSIYQQDTRQLDDMV